MSRRNLLLASTLNSGGKLIENKAILVEDGHNWKIRFEYPINSDLHIIFSDGECYVILGSQTINTGYPSFDKPTIVKIEPQFDDIYQYTF